MSKYRELRDKLAEVVAEIEYGEALYDGGADLERFIRNCEDLKQLAKALYEENRAAAIEDERYFRGLREGGM